MDPRVIYVRWAYSPTTGDVTLSHNHESTPSQISFHGDLGRERSEQDLVFGYAYRQPFGWRVTGADHKPMIDPHVVDSVVNEINSLGV